MQMQFTKLGNYPRYTDIIIVGIDTSITRGDLDIDSVCEKINRYNILHCKIKNGQLLRMSEITEFEGHDVFTSILSYYQLGKRTLLVCNNSLVFLGSSDFVAVLENDIYRISTGDMYGEQINESDNHKVSQQQFIASAPPTVVCINSRQTNSEITIVDIANYGIKNIKRFFMDFDLNVISEFRNYADRLLDPDKSDVICIAMYLVLRKYVSICHKHKLGGIAVTYSGQAMRAFRGSHYDGTISKHNDEQCAYVEEQCYRGGRCEDRWRGRYEGKVYLIDVNSFYPSIACKKPFPRRLVKSAIYTRGDSQFDRDDNKYYMSHCRVSQQESIIGVKIDGKTVYPIGDFDTYICGEEYTEANKRGMITHHYYRAEYETGLILKPYAEYMLDVRSQYKRNGDAVSEKLVKFITNGLWGKFAEIGSRWIIDKDVTTTCQYGGFSQHDPKTELYTQYRVIDGEASRLARAYWTDNTFLPITAAMNSYCRMALWRYAQLAGMSNVLYFGIDALIVTQAGLDNLSVMISDNPQAYGMFRVSEQGDSCYIAGPGRYRIGDKIAMSGIPVDDEYRYRGFWNCHDDRYIVDSSKGIVRTTPTRRRSPSLERKIFGHDTTSLGDWVQPVVIRQDRIDDPPVYRREIQSSFRIDDFLQ